MSKPLAAVIFLLGIFLGSYAASNVGEELVYKVPAKYLTMSRDREMQTVDKILNSDEPETGKIIFILGGSSSFFLANEHRLEKVVSERIGEPVDLHILGTPNQNFAESYGFVEKFPKLDQPGKGFVLLTWTDPRTLYAPKAAIDTAFKRHRMLFRNDALRKLIKEDDLLNESFMALEKEKDPNVYMANVDVQHTSSVGSHWLNYFIYDKVNKLSAKKIKWDEMFVSKDVFMSWERENEVTGILERSIEHERARSRIDVRHERYIRVLKRTRNYRSKKNRLEMAVDFATYFIDKTYEASEKRGYEMAIMELPMHQAVYEIPELKTHRENFRNSVEELSESRFQNFYLASAIPELENRYHWSDAGHLNSKGRQIFEPMLVDIIVAMIQNGDDGVYGDSGQK